MRWTHKDINAAMMFGSGGTPDQLVSLVNTAYYYKFGARSCNIMTDSNMEAGDYAYVDAARKAPWFSQFSTICIHGVVIVASRNHFGPSLFSNSR